MSSADPRIAGAAGATGSGAGPSSATASAGVRVVEALERLGVTVAFGLPGVHNLAIWKALSESSISLVGVRHEQAAVYAADGYARAWTGLRRARALVWDRGKHGPRVRRGLRSHSAS